MPIQEDWTLPGAPDDPTMRFHSQSNWRAFCDDHARAMVEKELRYWNDEYSRQMQETTLAYTDRITALEAALTQANGALEELQAQVDWLKNQIPAAYQAYLNKFYPQ